MKKILLLVITLITFTNVSYASFPVTNTFSIRQDAITTKSIDPITKNIEFKEQEYIKIRRIWTQVLIIIMLVALLFGIGILILLKENNLV